MKYLAFLLLFLLGMLILAKTFDVHIPTMADYYDAQSRVITEGRPASFVDTMRQMTWELFHHE